MGNLLSILPAIMAMPKHLVSNCLKHSNCKNGSCDTHMSGETFSVSFLPPHIHSAIDETSGRFCIVTIVDVVVVAAVAMKRRIMGKDFVIWERWLTDRDQKLYECRSLYLLPVVLFSLDLRAHDTIGEVRLLFKSNVGLRKENWLSRCGGVRQSKRQTWKSWDSYKPIVGGIC
jgi:hypothetical protein